MHIQNAKRGSRIKLFFNPASGAKNDSPVHLMEVIKEIQVWNLTPEPYLTEKDSNYARVIRDAINDDINFFAVCGGDGTVSAIARELVDTDAVLGIIPRGTQNNIAYSLGIPFGMKQAIANLQYGRKIKTDVGVISCGEKTLNFLEVCSVGLFSALYSSGDDIQHGDISRIGDFLSTLTNSVPSEICLVLDNKQKIKALGYVVLVSNMPFVGRRYQVAFKDSFCDGYLDVLFCTDVPKLDLIVGYMLKSPEAEDPRIMHFKAESVEISARPGMPVMADGMEIDGDPVHIDIKRHALAIIAGEERNNETNRVYV